MMQKAIENYIDVQSKLGKLFDEIKIDIDKVEEVALRKARKKQYRQWRINQRPIRR